MDRLSIIALVVSWLAAAGCRGSGSSRDQASAASGRVAAVMAEPEKAVNLDDLCEKRPSKTEARSFHFPALAEDLVGPQEGWRWINVWATWCAPCVEELPRLSGWPERLQKEQPIPLRFLPLSVDQDGPTVEAFRAQHPSMPPTLRIRDAAELAPWLTSLGLDESSVLPIHLFVDPEARLRCVRMGPVQESDFAAVSYLLGQG